MKRSVSKKGNKAKFNIVSFEFFCYFKRNINKIRFLKMNTSMDNIDNMILNQLLKNGRASHAAIGKSVGLTGPSVYSRIQKMEREGIIRGYSVHLDPAKVDHELLAFIRVGTYATSASDEQDEFERFVMNENRILECHDVDGEDSYLLKVRTDCLKSLRDLLARIRGISSVSRTVSSINMVTVKEEGITAPVTLKNTETKES